MSSSSAPGIRMGAAFHFNFGASITEGLAVVGKFDGKFPSLACATAGNRIMLHDSKPREMSSGELEPAIHFLNFNKQPTALASGSINGKGDALIMGSATSVTAYSVDNNSDVFYKEVADGVFAAVCGTFGPDNESLVFVGGNCSVVGLDAEGQEKYWIVTGDHVSSLAILPWKAGAPNCLLTGAADYEIRVFDGQQTICNVTEADRITRLVAAGQPGRFAYALANGAIGVYEQHDRVWRTKAKAQPTSFAFCDVDFDGVPELVCGWSDGHVDVRVDGPGVRTNGDVIYKEVFGSPVSAVVTADYRMDGRTLPIVCTFDGEVRGLIALETSVDEAVENKEKLLLDTLIKEKQQLQFDLKNLDSQIIQSRATASSGASHGDAQTVSSPNAVMLNPNTSIKVRLRPVSESKSIDLCLTASDNAVIRGAFVSGELIFPSGDCAFYHTETPSGTLSCPITLEKDVATDLSLGVLVGSELSTVFQVHELKFRLPKFCMYVPVQDMARKPTGYVVARIAERSGRYHSWLSTCFNATSSGDQEFSATFVSLRDGQCLHLAATANNGGEFVVHSDDMDVCGEIIQDLGAFLGLTELESVADFPGEFERFKDVLQRVEEYNNVRMKLTADMADSTQMVKSLVIKAEDARILNDMRLMKKMYGSLYEVNRELIGEYMKRSNNHNELLSALKEVNSMIQKAGKLRIGQAKNRLVTECRTAIKANNIHTLFNIIRNGKLS